MGLIQSRAYVGVLAALSLLACASSLLYAEPQDGYYYMFKKERIPMALDHSRIAVFQEAAVDDGARDAANVHLANALGEMGFAPEGMKAHAFKGWTYAALPQNERGLVTVQDVVFQLAAARTADFISPVFIDEYGPRLVTRDILVGFHDDLNHDQADEVVGVMGLGEIIGRDYSGIRNLYLIRSSSRNGFEVLEKANAAALRDEVAYAEPDMIFTMRNTLIPNDPQFSQLWGIRQASDFDMDGDEAWDITIGSPSVITVVLDDGVELGHGDLNTNIAAGIDTTGSGTGGNHVANNPCEGHGTNVAGCIAAIINNNTGVVGIAPGTRIGAAKFTILNQPCDGTGSGCTTCAVNAITWSTTIGARITNTSYSLGQTGAVDSAYQTTRAQGVVHMASTGNSGAGSIAYPASSQYVMGIGSVQSNGTRSSFSQFGTGISHMAPGSSIRTTNRGNSYATVSGTSFSSPYAAGVGALVVSQNNLLSAANIESILQSTCMDMGAAGYDTTHGWGLTNARAALQATPNPAPPQAFALQTPANGEINVIRLPSFSWSSSLFAQNYELTIDDDADFSSPVVVHNTTLTGYTHAGTPLIEATTYYWKVVASNPLGTRDSNPVVSSFETISVPPMAFNLSLPAAGATNVSLTPSFQWTIAPLSETYTLQVDNDADFSSPTINVNTTLPGHNPLAPLAPGTVYHWRVFANNPIGSTLSTPGSRSFTTLSNPPQGFNLQSPTDGSVIMTFTPALNWTDSPGAVSYRVQVDDVQTFASPEIDESDLESSDFMVPEGILQNSTRYYWRVFAINQIGQTPSTPAVYSFVVFVPVCCPGNADKFTPGSVTFADITTVLANFGNTYPNGNGQGDSDCNGIVNFADVTSTLANFNNVCP